MTDSPIPVNYPLNKHEARTLLQLEGTEVLDILLRCISFESQVYAQAAMQVGYGPYAIEKFRSYSGIANRLPMLIPAVFEAANAVVNDVPSLMDIGSELDLS